MLQQFSKSLSILDICLTAWNILYVLSIYQKHLETTLQKIVYWLPIISCAFHGNVTTSPLKKPIHQFQEFWCGSPKALDSLLLPTVASASDNCLLVNIQTSTVLITNGTN
jgi:hypothetical protein